MAPDEPSAASGLVLLALWRLGYLRLSGRRLPLQVVPDEQLPTPSSANRVHAADLSMARAAVAEAHLADRDGGKPQPRPEPSIPAPALASDQEHRVTRDRSIAGGL